MSKRRWLKKVALSLLLSLTGSLAPGAAQSPMPAESAPAPTPIQAHKPALLDLPGCLSLTEQRQPRLAAARASLGAAEDGKRAVDNIHTPPLVGRELPIRRKQASLGVSAATAAVDVAEHDAIYAVTRNYFTVLYSREQKKVADGVVGRLTATYETAKKQLDAGAADVTSDDVNRTLTYLRLAESKQVQAAKGVQRALVALREAIALDPCWDLDVRGDTLPMPTAVPNRCEVVSLAVARRGELGQASLFAEIAGLEVEAQGTTTHRRMQTFAAGSDIHSRQVPQEIHNSEYRPGGVPPEYPTLLAGSREERMKHAESLHARAATVVDTTRNLIVLETEDAFLRWEEAKGEADKAREAADAGDKLAEGLRKGRLGGQKVTIEALVNGYVLASQARSQYNEYLYRQILALADLERATAGGFCAGLVADLAAPVKAPEKKPGDKGPFDVNAHR
jgi:outer membrane protein TolC